MCVEPKKITTVSPTLEPTPATPPPTGEAKGSDFPALGTYRTVNGKMYHVARNSPDLKSLDTFREDSPYTWGGWVSTFRATPEVRSYGTLALVPGPPPHLEATEPAAPHPVARRKAVGTDKTAEGDVYVQHGVYYLARRILPGEPQVATVYTYVDAGRGAGSISPRTWAENMVNRTRVGFLPNMPGYLAVVLASTEDITLASERGRVLVPGKDVPEGAQCHYFNTSREVVLDQIRASGGIDKVTMHDHSYMRTYSNMRTYSKAWAVYEPLPAPAIKPEPPKPSNWAALKPGGFVLRQSGRLEWKVSGDNHCGHKDYLIRGAIQVKYDLAVHFSGDALDARGFLIDQQELADALKVAAGRNTDASCEVMALVLARHVLATFGPTGRGRPIVKVDVTVSPKPYGGSLEATVLAG